MTIATVASKFDPFSVLHEYDTVFIVDDSWSMKPRWGETCLAVKNVVEKSIKYDEDGIDIYFFNDSGGKNLKTDGELDAIFQKLEVAHAAKRLNPKMVSGKIKPLNVVILTDGVPFPWPRENPEAFIVSAAKRLGAIIASPEQVGLSFVQIGNHKEAAEALDYYDSMLTRYYGIRDMVDTVRAPPGGQVTSAFLEKALLGGIDRHVDHQSLVTWEGKRKFRGRLFTRNANKAFHQRLVTPNGIQDLNFRRQRRRVTSRRGGYPHSARFVRTVQSCAPRLGQEQELCAMLRQALLA